MSNFLFPGEHPGRFGGKGAALARLGSLGFEIPPWFAVPHDAKWTAAELTEATQKLGPGPYAVRSSGASEDGAGHSFAGQFASFLDVEPPQIEARIADVRNSANTAALLEYCREHNIPSPSAPTVLVQQMIAPRAAGVAFSADPVSGRRRVTVVSAVAGLAEALVSGEAEGETWQVERGGPITQPPEATVLSADDVQRIAQLAIRSESVSGSPQDIEWALDSDGKLWLLQSRPITTIAKMPDPDDPLCIWDNSNIAESYAGVTTPLTFSFASGAYDAVYREFCLLMSVPTSRVDSREEVFANMLGLVRGRVYYNLVNWYRVLAMLPGFRMNRGFMEQMMGVREPMPDEIMQAVEAENKGSNLADGLALLRGCLGLVLRLAGLRRQIEHFQKRLNEALDEPANPLSRMSGSELVAHYRALECSLLRRWDAPLVNDFFAMIFYGLLRSVCTKWAGDTTGSLQNELLLDCGEIISAEPPRRIQAMALLARTRPDLARELADPDLPTPPKLLALEGMPELQSMFAQYLEDFGDRCLEELKLESPTVVDDASSLLLAIGALALRPENPVEEDSSHTPSEAEALQQLTWSNRWLFHWILNQARLRVRWRENLRFERTRVFGRVRQIFRELGKRLAADGQLNSADNIFYLEVDEILRIWEGTSTTQDFAALAQQRKSEFSAFHAEPAPPDRFMTRGGLHRHASFKSTSTAPQDFAGDAIQGTGASPGIVQGRVRVVLDPRAARLEQGEILVARQTDPGWVVLFPAAAGLLVERGSLLSHSAIVSRELRLPCVVSLPRITERLKTGDFVEMNGRTGTVRILKHLPTPP